MWLVLKKIIFEDNQKQYILTALAIVTYALSQLSHKGKEFIFHNLSFTVVSMSELINQECIQLYIAVVGCGSTPKMWKLD